MPETSQAVANIEAIMSLDLLEQTNEVEGLWLQKEKAWINDAANAKQVNNIIGKRAQYRAMKLTLKV